jgi:NitT/TauT family transport system permease protein/putative hydroxymethylpyrimidine transport system permease protein
VTTLGRRLRGATALHSLLLLALFFGAWEIYVETGGVDSLVLPAPHQVARALFDDRGLLWSNFGVTAEEVVLGILVAAAAGLGGAIAIHFIAPLRRAAYPLLVASQTIPIPMLAPLLWLWLGFGLGPKLAVVGLISFFPILVTTLDALARVEPQTIALLRTLDASRFATFRHAELPAALPGVFSGAKIAVAIAVIGAVLGELSGSESGLGHLYQQSIPQLLTARAFAAVAILSLFAIALFGLLTLIERRALPWSQPTRGDAR